MSQNSDRRSFIKLGLMGFVLTPAIGVVSRLIGANAYGQQPAAPAKGAAAPAKDAKAKPAPTNMLNPKDQQAQSLGYYEDATKVDTKKWPQRADATGPTEFCWNCQFYQWPDKTTRKTSGVAPCTIFGNKSVKAQGWCMTWALDPTVKS